MTGFTRSHDPVPVANMIVSFLKKPHDWSWGVGCREAGCAPTVHAAGQPSGKDQGLKETVPSSRDWRNRTLWSLDVQLAA